jgi:predicted MFS family arabinose efflux permease
MGVGIGEAGGVAPSYALISDYFPPHRRARALAIFSFGIPIGSSLGLFVGGWIADAINWRAAFIIMGVAGLLIVPLVKLGLKEPVRGGHDDAKVGEPAPSFRTVFMTFARKPSFWLISFAAASGSIVGYGLLFWLPSFFTRSFGFTLLEASVFYGSIVLVGGLIGTWSGGWIADRIGSGRPSRYALLPAICFLIAAPAYAIGLFAPSLFVGFAMFLIPQALGLVWLGPIVTAIQHIVPPNMRATTSASFLFINNLIGLGFGIPFLGYVSDQLKGAYGEESLRYSILYVLGFYVLSAALYFLASRTLKRDWHRA